MEDIFGLGMLGNYDQRKVARFENKDLIIDTCSVTDSNFLFETAVSHDNYNNGKWVVVENYNDKESAETGHKQWIKKMTSKKLPEKLEDVSGCFFAKILRDNGGLTFKKEIKNG